MRAVRASRLWGESGGEPERVEPAEEATHARVTDDPSAGARLYVTQQAGDDVTDYDPDGRQNECPNARVVSHYQDQPCQRGMQQQRKDDYPQQKCTVVS